MTEKENALYLLLGEIKQSVIGLREDVRLNIAPRIESNSARIRALEKNQWKLSGALVVAVFVFSFLAEHVKLPF